MSILSKIYISLPKRAEIVFYDVRYPHLFKNLKLSYVSILRPNEKFNIIFLLYALKYPYQLLKNNLGEVYLLSVLKTIKPRYFITTSDLDYRVFKLSQRFKEIKFILIQDSYRIKSTYKKHKLKSSDILIKYSPLINFNFTNTELVSKPLKYNFIKNIEEIELTFNFIFISQFRPNWDTLTTIQKKILNQELTPSGNRFYHAEDKLLTYLSEKYFKGKNKLYYKSSFRSTKPQKLSEVNYLNEEEVFFQKYNFQKFNISNNQILFGEHDLISLIIDSTMIFDLLFYGKKVLVYDYRAIFLEQESNPHLNLLKKEFPFIFLEKSLNDFHEKYSYLKNISLTDYQKDISIYFNTPQINLNNILK